MMITHFFGTPYFSNSNVSKKGTSTRLMKGGREKKREWRKSHYDVSPHFRPSAYNKPEFVMMPFCASTTGSRLCKYLCVEKKYCGFMWCVYWMEYKNSHLLWHHFLSRYTYTFIHLYYKYTCIVHSPSSAVVSLIFRHSLHLLRCRWCSQMLVPPHSWQVLWCSQMPLPPHLIVSLNPSTSGKHIFPVAFHAS